MGNHSYQEIEVTVGDGAMRVGSGHQVCSHYGWKSGVPKDVGVVGGLEPSTAYASGARVQGTNIGRGGQERRVGRMVRLVARCWKSRRKALTAWVARTWFAEAVAKACCSKLNKPLLPGRAGSMPRSSPKSICQCWCWVRRQAPKALVRRAWSFLHW